MSQSYTITVRTAKPPGKPCNSKRKPAKKKTAKRKPDYDFGVSKADIVRYKEQSRGTWKGGKALA